MVLRAPRWAIEAMAIEAFVPQDHAMADLWLATANAKKGKELERILAPLGLRLRTMKELREPLEIVEDAPDFAGNAAKKAVTLARVVHDLALGDDSGLCVDALNGRPGVLSARYAGPDASDSDRIQKLLGELAGVPPPRRTARFVCSICVADRDGRILVAVEETCEGRILEASRGSEGFGYDPVFSPHASPNRSFAELPAVEKDSFSHRGKALVRLAQSLSKLEQRPQ